MEKESITKEQIEEFFVTLLFNVSKPYTSYLNFPDNNSFTYCLKEIKHSLNNCITNNLNNNYSRILIENFYRYMQKDIIFKEVDSIKYRELMLKLKLFSEGEKVSKKEQFSYFEYIERAYVFAYKEKLYNKILESYNNPKSDWNYYDILFNCFINELLANGINYKYLYHILLKYKECKFNSFLEFIEYLQFGNKDCYDIYIPLKNVIEKNFEYFKQNNQQIISIDEHVYCKVYSNKCIDFYFVIKQNIIRIEAMLNILRLYSKSNIDFDYENTIIVESKFFNQSDIIEFSEIMCYKGNSPYYKHLNTTLESLEKLKDIDKVLYHKVLNVISYAEKDKDVCNHSSYVDNWISLETLCSLSERKNGYEAVEYNLSKILAPKIITSYITDILKQAYGRYNSVRLEDLIKQSIEDSIDLARVKNVYFKFVILKYSNILKNINKFKMLFEEIENRINLDVLRIYMLRNEYVHESNIHAFNSMQQIKLKNLLTMALDEFFKTLNRRIGLEYCQLGLNYEIFTHMLNRYEARQTVFNVMTTKCKVGNNIDLSTSLSEENIEMHELILNLLKNNLNPFKKYTSYQE